MENQQLVELTTDIVSAHVAHNNVDVGQVATLVQQVYGALARLGQQEEQPEAKVPVVSIRASIRPDHLICMECGKKQTMLKRHLQTAHGMSPGEYRQDYGLPDTYPMIAPEYGERRRAIAKVIGLGRKRGGEPSVDATSTKQEGATRGGGGGGTPDSVKAPKEARKPRKKKLSLFG